MKRIEASVVVNCRIDEVWVFLTDLFSVPRYGASTLGLRQTSPGPIGVGTTVQGRVVILGMETRVRGVVTEWDPPHAMAFSARGAGMRSGSFRQTLEPTADGTKVVRVLEVEPRPILKLLWWIVGTYFRRQADADARNIKRLLEAGRS